MRRWKRSKRDSWRKTFWDTEVAEVQSFSMTNNRKSSKEGNGIPPWPRYIPKKVNQKVNININTLKQDIKIKSFSVEMYQKKTAYYLFVKKNSKFFNKIVFLNHYKLNYIRRQCPFYVKKKWIIMNGIVLNHFFFFFCFYLSNVFEFVIIFVNFINECILL